MSSLRVCVSLSNSSNSERNYQMNVLLKHGNSYIFYFTVIQFKRLIIIKALSKIISIVRYRRISNTVWLIKSYQFAQLGMEQGILLYTSSDTSSEMQVGFSCNVL